jgi:hypothetical protein
MSYARAEHLIRPEVIDVLNGEVGLVGPGVLVGCRKALSQCEQMLKPMGPLGFALVRHDPIRSKGYQNLTVNLLPE